MKHINSSVHQFTSLENAGFTANEYSRLKFGSNEIARKFGYELAYDFFAKYADVLLSNSCVVIPSPYNYVENAATIMTKHYIAKLNELLVNANGNHVEYDIIHRKISYVSDYGFLTKEKRKGLINGDQFYLNKDFYKDKTLIFVDDVKITGTHEDKLVEILKANNINNNAFFIYFAQYEGINAKIEAEINFAAIKDLKDFIEVSTEHDHHMIVRPIKYLLGHKDHIEVRNFFIGLKKHAVFKSKLDAIYYGCLGEGYYKIPTYQHNFEILSEVMNGAN